MSIWLMIGIVILGYAVIGAIVWFVTVKTAKPSNTGMSASQCKKEANRAGFWLGLLWLPQLVFIVFAGLFVVLETLAGY